MQWYEYLEILLDPEVSLTGGDLNKVMEAALYDIQPGDKLVVRCSRAGESFEVEAGLDDLGVFDEIEATRIRGALTYEEEGLQKGVMVVRGGEDGKRVVFMFDEVEADANLFYWKSRCVM